MTHLIKRLNIIFLAIILSTPALVLAQDSPQAFIDLIEGKQEAEGEYSDQTVEELMETFKVPGFSIAVIKDFEIHWAKGYGVADTETGKAVDNETLFQAASISKPVAAMAVMKAVQDGVFSLDDDINTILTSWQLPASEFTESHPVTPRMLTSHTSGLGDGFGFPGYKPGTPIPNAVQIMNGEEPSNVGAVTMERPPMTAMKYSGGGVTMMQLALSDAVDMPFHEVAQAYVLDPIGMSNSTFVQPLPADWDENATRAHNRAGAAMDVKWHVYPEQAAAGLWTTSSDLAKFAIEVQKSIQGKSNKVLSQSSVQEMVSPVGVGGFAVGFSIRRIGEGWYFSHSGANWGFRCSLVAHKMKGYGVVVMTNSSRGAGLSQEIRQRVERAYKWDTLDEPVPR
jgi:CubicO group peptidase (beta-lactamase class C family)